MFYRLVIGICTVFCLTGNAFGQIGTPDTLDATRYYPLEVGNIWEWKIEMPEGYSRLEHAEIVDTTTVADVGPLFVQVSTATWQETGSSERITQTDTTLLTYINAVGGGLHVYAWSEDVGGLVPYAPYIGEKFNVPYNGGPFGGGESVEGGYANQEDRLAIGPDRVPYGALKSHIINAEGQGYDYYHGIGRLPRLGFDAPGNVGFTYVRVDDIEYGIEEFVVNTGREQPVTRSMVNVYPTPAQTDIVLEGSERFEYTMYDLLGRKVSNASCSGRCNVDVSGWAPGMYWVRTVSNRNGGSEVKQFVIRR